MAGILSLDDYIASYRQTLQYIKTTSRTTIANAWFSLFELAGLPGAGVLAGTSTAAGVVPTNATAGCMLMNAFPALGLGYLTTVDFGGTVAGRWAVFDMLFKAGAYAFNAAVSLAAQPSYSARVPFLADGSTPDYTGLQIWLECVTAFTGNLSIAVTYTNQAGTAARTTGTIALGLAPTLGRMIQLNLAAGDTGVQKIESVTGTIATVGTFNILVLRPLWYGRTRAVNDGDTHGLDKIGMPQVFATSALIVAACADSTSSGIPEMQLEVASK